MSRLKWILLRLLGLHCDSQAVNWSEHRVHSCRRRIGHGGEHRDEWGHW